MSKEPSLADTGAAARALVGVAKRRTAAVDRTRIIEIAQILVDNSGLDALTMRNLARTAGVSVNTVYATAGDKEAILQGMVNALLDEILPGDQAAADPTAELISFFRQVHDVFVAHPAIGHLAALRPIYGPAVFSGLSSVFSLLGKLGLDEPAAVSTCHTLISYTIGFSVHRGPRDNPEVISAQHQRISALAARDQAGSALLEEYVRAPGHDAQFVAGLNLILRGATRPGDD